MQKSPYYIQKGHVFAVPCVHYQMEFTLYAKLAIEHIQPDCIAVELPETMQKHFLHAASRLPDISVIATKNQENTPFYFMSEPCDAMFEGLRSAIEHQIAGYCIDLDVDEYVNLDDVLPDSYAVHFLGLKTYYENYQNNRQYSPFISPNPERHVHMARRLKELSLCYDRILFIGSLPNIEPIIQAIDKLAFPFFYPSDREFVQLCTLTEKSCRTALAEYGYLSIQYEKAREKLIPAFFPDRQKIIYQLYKEASVEYIKETKNSFPPTHLRTILKFTRNYAWICGQLLPDLYKIIEAAKGCVDSSYAYEVWQLATSYPFRMNIDGLEELDLSVEDMWGSSQKICFHLKYRAEKEFQLLAQRQNRSSFHFDFHSFSICSYPPEDIKIEKFGHFLKKKAIQILSEETAKTIPFSTSLEDGIDMKETIRHWQEKKLFVKTNNKPLAVVGSTCVIFDPDKSEKDQQYQEKYPWCMAWHGEHAQESDMAFYSTFIGKEIIGPGISRCEYGGFMMSYPPRRLHDIWHDTRYKECRSKAEVLLMAAIEYAMAPIIVYVAAFPPRSLLKSFANRLGKKIAYLPIGQLSPILLNKLRHFHVLDGHDKRKQASDYIH